MVKKNFIFVFLLITQVCLAQDSDDITKSYELEIQEKFKRNGVATFFFFKMHTPGATFISKKQSYRCTNSANITYVFWKEDNTNWMKKLSPCGVSNTLKVPLYSVIDVFLENEERIETEKVKNYEVQRVGNRNDSIHSLFISRTHTPLRVFEFHNSDTIYTKRIHKYKLTHAFGEENLNFEYNNSLPLVALNHQCEEIISIIEEKKLLDEYLTID